MEALTKLDFFWALDDNIENNLGGAVNPEDMPEFVEWVVDLDGR